MLFWLDCKMCHDFIWEIKWKEERLKCLNYADLDSCILLETISDRRKPECFFHHQMQILIVFKVKCCVAGTAVWHLLEPGAINTEYSSLDKGMQTK